jgi:phosphoglycerate dehydrogenase-like enzyme
VVERLLYTDAGEFPLLPDLADRARQAGVDFICMDGHDREEIIQKGGDCSGAFLYRGRIDADLLAALPGWRVLARIGTGYDLIDVAAAKRRGVMVTYVPDFCTEELSDMVLLFILAFARRLPTFIEAHQEHRWLPVSDIPAPSRLVGKTLGILGFGRSGQRAAEKARTFGMEVLVWTRTPRPEALSRIGARHASFEEALGCDYVSLHTPLTPQTEGLIGEDALRKMKPSAVLINVARGGVVNTDALVEALEHDRIAGAGLDVVTPAPLPPWHPLWGLPNVIITSHSGGLSTEAGRESQTTAVEDALAVLAGRTPRFPVPELAP